MWCEPNLFQHDNPVLRVSGEQHLSASQICAWISILHLLAARFQCDGGNFGRKSASRFRREAAGKGVKHRPLVFPPAPSL